MIFVFAWEFKTFGLQCRPQIVALLFSGHRHKFMENSHLGISQVCSHIKPHKEGSHNSQSFEQLLRVLSQ